MRVRNCGWMSKLLVGMAVTCCVSSDVGCSSSPRQLANDPYGPLSGDAEQLYLDEMEQADAYVPHSE